MAMNARPRVSAKPLGVARWELLVTFVVCSLYPLTRCQASAVTTAYGNGLSKRTTYRAAVYEHSVIFPTVFDKAVPRAEALKTMDKNLAVYETQAQLAKAQKADILVFPEDGVYGMKFTREAIYPYLEAIPDPKTVTWSPCADPTRFPESEVQHALSCMAMKNGMYIVADVGDKVPCNKRKDPNCPDDGRYQYNTAVAYDPTGTLVAKYHKRHLFGEIQFDTPVAENIFFDTPFGRFGMLVCFDLLFFDPAVTLVIRHNVTNILFPTAWMDALPLLSAIGYHSSFARGLGVNLLSANVHLPSFRFHGSGVYTPKGMATFYYDNSLLSPAKLLVSEIPILEAQRILKRVTIDSHISGSQPLRFNADLRPQDEFKAEVFHDLFTFRALRQSSGEIRVCNNGICCYLKYELEKNHSIFKDLLAFGAFDGLHTYEGQYYLQVCTLLKCASSLSSSCGSKTFHSSTKFKSLSIHGEFQTPYIFPQAILSNGGQLELAQADAWTFNATGGQNKTVAQIASLSGFEQPLLSATLFGRYYRKDNGAPHLENRKTNKNRKLASNPSSGSSSCSSNALTYSLLIFLSMALS